MASVRRPIVEVAATRQLQPLLSREGAKVRRARRRRKWSQTELGRRAGLAQTTVSKIERGAGGALSLESWQQVGLVLALQFAIDFGRDALEEPADSGHLAIQELVLRLGRRAGYSRTYELPTKPSDPRLSVDVGLADDRSRRLLQIECVNVFGNVNAAVRSSDRKRAEADAYAAVTTDGSVYDVHQCWVVRATRRNRELLARYPEVFATAFPASSRGWVDALTKGAEPPGGRGLVWCDVATTRLFAWRRG